MSKQYEIRMYAFVDADSLEEAEMLYADGEYFMDYHEIIDWDENGNEIAYDQWDIERLAEEKANGKV